jgi:hypothetical protein
LILILPIIPSSQSFAKNIFLAYTYLLNGCKEWSKGAFWSWEIEFWALLKFKVELLKLI